MKTTHICCLAVACLGLGVAAAQQPARVNLVGGVQAIDTATGQITLQTDDGKTVKVAPHPNAKWLRLPPGEKSIAKAEAITAQDVGVGDRLLARGELSEDKTALAASTLVIMTKSDIAKKQQADRAEWAKRGVGGIVTAVDPAGGTVTITTRTMEGKKPLLIEVGKATSLRRYAPDSVKFADAKPSTLAQIKPGDQVRALGSKSEDGSRYTAEEVVSGSFRNVAATVKEVDSAEHILKVTDLTTKKTLTVRVNADSMMRKLPEFMARMIAMRISGAGGGAAAPGGPGAGGWQRPQGAAGTPAGGGARSGQWQGGGQGGPPRSGDMQAMLERMPALKLEDLKPGDAIIVSSTEGTDPSQVTAITLVAGVEPILTANSGGQRAAMLGSWNLDMGGGMGGGEQ